MNIGFITPWNTICGVSEFAHFLGGALEARGHELTIFANRYAGEYFPVEVRTDGPNVARIFETGFQADPAARQYFDFTAFQLLFTKRQCDVLLVNYQDYVLVNKPALNAAMQFARDRGARIILCFHDSCISPHLALSVAHACVFPPAMVREATFSTAVFIDQGIPEFDITQVVGPPVEAHQKWKLSGFGLGRNKAQELIGLIHKLNRSGLLRRPVSLQINAPKPNQEFTLPPTDEVVVTRGYLDPLHLAYHLHNTHACVIWYPEIAGISTSSAFRFAVGSRVPIICNQTNWVRDQRDNGCWVEVPGDDPEPFWQAIIGLFNEQTYLAQRLAMDEAQARKTMRSGWSEIAQQYEELFSAPPTV